MLRDTRDAISETSPFVLTGLFWLAIALPAVSAIGYGVYYFTAPATVAIENRTFHQSQPYQDGMARDLDNWRMQYASATPEGKEIIRATIQHRFAGFDASVLPSDDQAFLAEMK